ncbi:mono/diheme cytochrome c family protein [Aquimarina sp. MAR_2010_214]|uniref:c-type cytochrome n=1 Tax=Aquimarina sp. MAR_2010_214 TaxID=1250026 RepID=UPI000C71290B|nr:cytochrome c [Aquimarina sp. MAR_2010_214]PKV49270.1 mono/diheme cytochrome c family protein [Aquimarina sp. MAR_2010_214]
MIRLDKLMMLFAFTLLISCGGKEEKKEEQIKIGKSTTTQKKETKPVSTGTPASKTVDLTNKGVGPIKNLELDATIDQKKADLGLELFKTKCAACHKTHKKFIGPAPVGILERRTPEWVMNMILDPEKMIKEDPLAQELLKEFNGSPMANQSLTEEEARSILEYFRTLK